MGQGQHNVAGNGAGRKEGEIGPDIYSSFPLQGAPGWLLHFKDSHPLFQTSELMACYFAFFCSIPSHALWGIVAMSPSDSLSRVKMLFTVILSGRS